MEVILSAGTTFSIAGELTGSSFFTSLASTEVASVIVSPFSSALLLSGEVIRNFCNCCSNAAQTVC